jgi:hypothetical protein
MSRVLLHKPRRYALARRGAGMCLASTSVCAPMASLRSRARPRSGAMQCPARVALMSTRGDGRSRMLRTLAKHKAHAPLPLPAGHARMPPGLGVCPLDRLLCVGGSQAPLPDFHEERANIGGQRGGWQGRGGARVMPEQERWPFVWSCQSIAGVATGWRWRGWRRSSSQRARWW